MAKRKKKIELKTGDIIRITLDKDNYAFARVIAKDKLGDVIEVFSYITEDPNNYEDALKCERLHYPNIINSYSIFYIGEEGFDIVKQGDNSYIPKDYNELKYEFGSDVNPRFYFLDGHHEQFNGDNSYPFYHAQSAKDILQSIFFWAEKQNLHIVTGLKSGENELEKPNELEMSIRPFKYVGESVILSDLSYKKEGFESNTKDGI